MTVIDAHTHFSPVPYLSKIKSAPTAEERQIEIHMRPALERIPHATDVEKRLADLDKYQIDYEVATIQPTLDPNLLPVKDDKLIEYCRSANDSMAKMMNDSKGRIYSMGSIPINTPEGDAIDEMRRAVKDLGMRGFSVLSNIRGTPVDEFDFIWAEANRMGVPVWIHPADTPPNQCRRYEDEYDLLHVLGWPYETAILLSRLVLSGKIDKYPNTKVVSHHLGGMIPYLAGRLSESYDGKTIAKPDQTPARLSKSSVLDYFKSNFCYDTAVGGSQAAIKCCLDTFGLDSIVFATDYPWGPDGGRSRLATYPGKVRSIKLPKEDEEKILSGNISKVMRL
ncbi:MAG: amidohydrolase family protein [Nitrososphaerales archaeon]